jgi:hypothetical protein
VRVIRLFAKFFALYSLAPLLFAQGGPNYSINFGTIPTTFANSTSPKRFPVPLTGSGTAFITLSNIVGSPSACQVSLVAGGSQVTLNGTRIGAVSTFNSSSAFAPLAGNSIIIERVGQTRGIQTAIAGVLWWQCVTYPTSGTASIEFVPDPPITTPIWNAFYINTNTCTVLKNNAVQIGASEVHTLNIGTSGTAETLTIFDATGCTGNVLYKNTSMSAGSYLLDIYSDSGIWIQTAGTAPGDYTVTFR